MYEELAKRKATVGSVHVPALVSEFKLEYLPRLSPSARKEHDRLLTLFSNEFTDFKVDEIEATDIKQSIKNLFLGTGKLSAAKHYKARMSTFFRWCISDKGLVKINPCREVWIEKPRSRKTPWTDELFWQVHGKLSPMHQVYHELSFLLYQRTTDIRLLKRTQDRGDVIRFEPSKTAKSSGLSVDVPVTPAIRAVLDRAALLSRSAKVVSPYVIHTSSGTPFTRSGIHSAYRRADSELHGSPIGLNPKALLPFAVTSAKRQGATLEQLKVGRAHTSVKTTEGYVQHHDVPVSEVTLTLPPRK